MKVVLCIRRLNLPSFKVSVMSDFCCVAGTYCEENITTETKGRTISKNIAIEFDISLCPEFYDRLLLGGMTKKLYQSIFIYILYRFHGMSQYFYVFIFFSSMTWPFTTFTD